MSQPDYENKPDMTWEEFIKDGDFITTLSNLEQIPTVDKVFNDIIFTVGQDKTLFIQDPTDRFVNLGEFKSFKAIKRVIESIMEGVK